jgi:hypothetical protein
MALTSQGPFGQKIPRIIIGLDVWTSRPKRPPGGPPWMHLHMHALTVETQ